MNTTPYQPHEGSWDTTWRALLALLFGIVAGIAFLVAAAVWKTITATRWGCTKIAGWRSMAARRSHGPQAVGSNPTPAPKDETI